MGQWDDESVRYGFDGPNVDIAFRDRGLSFTLTDDGDRGLTESYAARSIGEQAPGLAPQGHDAPRTAEFDVSFNGSTRVSPVGVGSGEQRFNYLVGDSTNWVENASGFEAIAFSGLYDGIDLLTYGRRNSLKYEFFVSPDADYRQIQVDYDGIEGLWIDEAGRLRVETELGQLVDDAPYVYQVINGEEVEVGASFALVDSDSYSFEVSGSFDPSIDLVIDPNLDWSSYIGAAGVDEGRGVTVDSQGNVFVTGNTDSGGWTSGGNDTAHGGGFDGLVVKYSPSGAHLWSTYFGGSGDDGGLGIAVDAAGNPLVTGSTNSSGWVSGGENPTKSGAYDGFILKLGNDGTHLWSTYFGGAADDWGREIATDTSGNILVTGDTSSGGWTSGGWQTSYGGAWDGFAAKYSASGSHLWSSCLGGTSTDFGWGVASDSLDNVLLTGRTQSEGWVSLGEDSSFGGDWDGYVVKLTSNGSHAWSTYLGGDDFDRGYAVATDSFNNTFVTGVTESQDWVSGGWDTSQNGNGDGFIYKLSSEGSHFWSSYLGGSSQDDSFGVAVDDSDSVLVSGRTASSGWAVGGWDTTHAGGDDGFVLKASSTGSHLWSSYLGGSAADLAEDIVVDGSGNIIVGGRTSSSGWISGGWDTSHNGGPDGFVARITDDSVTTPIKILEFDVDGVLPSADPEIYVKSESSLDENAFFSVQGGVLEQRTKNVVGQIGYEYPDVNGPASPLSATASTTIEVRLNVIDIDGSGGLGYGADFGVFDGVNRYSLFFSESGVAIQTPTGFDDIPFDHTGYHTYRLTSPSSSNSVNLYIDGQLVHTALATSATAPGLPLHNGFYFGDTGAGPGNGADIDWDYVRVHQGIAPPLLTTHQLYENIAREFVYGSRSEGSTLDPWDGDQLGLGFGYQVDTEFVGAPGDGFYALGLTSPNNESILAFRGTNTDPLVDLVEDVLADLNPTGVGFGQFISYSAEVEAWIDAQAALGKEVALVGHSLGGALAQWTAADRTAAGGTIGEVVTFNSPGINAAFANTFVPSASTHVTHYITSGDVVSLAGEAFIEGDYTLTQFDLLGGADLSVLAYPYLAHVVPVLNDSVGANQRPDFARSQVTLSTDTLNSPYFGYLDTEYLGLLAIADFAVGDLIGHLPRHLAMRETTESLRVEAGEIIRGWFGDFATLVDPTTVDEASFELTLPSQQISFDLLPNVLSVPVATLVDVSLTHDTSIDSRFRLQGAAELIPLFNATADFRGDNYVEWTGKSFELVGEFSVANVPLSGGLLNPAWEIEEASVSVNTVSNELQGTVVLDVPFLSIDLGGTLGFEGGTLDTIGFIVDSIWYPLGNSFLNLSRIEGGLDHFSPSDPEPIEIFAGVVIKDLAGAALDHAIDLPFFFGADFEASLIELDAMASLNHERLLTDATVKLLSGKKGLQEFSVGTITGQHEINWASGTYSGSGQVNLLEGLATGQSHVHVDSQGKFFLSGEGPIGLPPWLNALGGLSSTGAFIVDVSNSPSQRDYLSAWAEVDLGLFGSKSLGGRWYLDGEFEYIGGKDILPFIQPAQGSAGDVIASGLGGVDGVQYDVAAGAPWAMFSADWENASSTAELQIVTPSGVVLNEADILNRSDMTLVDALDSDNRRVVYIEAPEMGVWHACVVGDASIGVADINALQGVAEATVEITSLAGGLSSPVEIGYVATAGDLPAEVSLFYDTDNFGIDGIPIIDGLLDANGAATLSWTPQGATPGSYYVYAVVDDGVNVPRIAYSDQPIFLAQLPGDYDLDGRVTQSDYVAWLANFGAIGQNAADGNIDGVVDIADYSVWRDNLGASAIPQPVLPGDYDASGVVDQLDYDLWASLFGAVVPLGFGADGNQDGIVDALDFSIWRDNLGASLPAFSSAVSSRAQNPIWSFLGAQPSASAGNLTKATPVQSTEQMGGSGNGLVQSEILTLPNRYRDIALLLVVDVESNECELSSSTHDDREHDGRGDSDAGEEITNAPIWKENDRFAMPK